MFVGLLLYIFSLTDCSTFFFSVHLFSLFSFAFLFALHLQSPGDA